MCGRVSLTPLPNSVVKHASYTLRFCFGIITGETQHEDEWRWQKGFGRPKLQQSFHRIQCWWMFSCFKNIKSGNMCCFYALEVPPSCDVTTWVPFFVLQTIYMLTLGYIDGIHGTIYSSTMDPIFYVPQESFNNFYELSRVSKTSQFLGPNYLASSWCHGRITDTRRSRRVSGWCLVAVSLKHGSCFCLFCFFSTSIL